jgi:hypothetical protein
MSQVCCQFNRVVAILHRNRGVTTCPESLWVPLGLARRLHRSIVLQFNPYGARHVTHETHPAHPFGQT